jgi:hypothetical protein
VVIATIFLIIIGMSAGLALGSRDKRNAQNTRAGDSPATAVTTPTPARPSGTPCREETQRAARAAGAQGELTIVLLLRTRSSAVWICADQAGRLYYHANRGGEDAEWIEGQTALFLDGVQRDGDDYEVTAHDGTTFSVNKQRLRIVHQDGRVEIQTAD